jgi:hypothetical protein
MKDEPNRVVSPLERLIRTFIPDLDSPGPIFACGNPPLERPIFKRMIGNLNGHPARPNCFGNPFGHSPALEYTISLEPEVKMQRPRPVFLHHKSRVVGRIAGHLQPRQKSRIASFGSNPLFAGYGVIPEITRRTPRRPCPEPSLSPMFLERRPLGKDGALDPRRWFLVYRCSLEFSGLRH